jgi:YD repeat-containing protein
MTGKPAARITDKVAGGKIVTGSLTVLIGSQGGIACSVCPGGQGVGSPVNPQLGAKVLTGSEDLDFALPGPLPVVWQRQYSSYINLEQGSRCGPLGHGWKLPQQLRIELTQDDCLLHDAAGRTLTFGALAPGQSLYSASEDIWIVRGGQEAAWHSEARWSHVPPSWAGSPDCILAASGNAAVVWAFAPVAAFEPALTPPAPQHWRLQAQLDRFGRSQRYTYAPKPDAQETQETQKTQASRSKQATTGSELLQVHQAHQAPVPEGHLIGLTDGAGRSYRLHYQQVCSASPAQGLWGEDDGWRLASVELVSDPVGTGTLPLTLVHYGYDRTGQLSTVHDRTGTTGATGALLREFSWQHRRMSSHRYASGPLHTYIYESTEPGARVIEHGNEQGLNYRFEYLKQNPSPAGLPQTATRVTDSLGRIDTYHYEGQAGLARLVRHQRADGSELRYSYDAAGRLSSSTDPLGRTTRLQRDSQGQLTSVQSPSDKPGGQRSCWRHLNSDPPGVRIKTWTGFMPQVQGSPGIRSG